MTLARFLTDEPVSTPTFTLRTDDVDVEPGIEVASIVITRQVNKVATAEVYIYDGDAAKATFEVSSSSAFEPGKKIQIDLGYMAKEETIFKGIIVGQSIKVMQDQASILKLTCKHEAVKLTIGRRTAYYYNKLDSEIIDQLGSPAGVDMDVERTTIQHPEMVQYYTTDWDFIVTRAEANGMLVFTEDETMKVAKPDFFQLASTEALYGATILSMEAEIDARTQYKAVDAFAWQPQKQEMEQVNGRDPNVASPGNLSSMDLAGVVGPDSFEIRHAGHLKDVELQEWANAQWLKSQLSKVCGRVRLQGIKGIKPGDLIDLGGLGERFNGSAYVTGVRHEFDAGNWEMDVVFGMDKEWFCEQHNDVTTMPAEGLLPAVSGLQIGIVTKLQDDPEGEDRIRVRLPMLDTIGDGVWARVACLDAGNERGTFFRPEINDEVIVGFLSDDPRYPVVLGQLNSSSHPAPVQVQDTNHEKGIYTRDKLKLVFNDDEKSVTVETPAGNKLVLTDDDASITWSDQHGNTIKMDADGILLQSASDIKIQANAKLEATSGAAMDLKASAKLTAEGSASADFKSGGQTVLKGAMVKIN